MFVASSGLASLECNGLTFNPQNPCSFAWGLSLPSPTPPGACSARRVRELKLYYLQQLLTNQWKKLRYKDPRFLVLRWESWKAPFTLAPRVWIPAAHSGNSLHNIPLLRGCVPFRVLVSSSLSMFPKDHLPNKLIALDLTLRVCFWDCLNHQSPVFHVTVSIYHHVALSFFSW